MPGGTSEDEVAPHEVVLIMLHYLRSKGLKSSFSALLAEAKQQWTIVEPRPGSLRDLGAILQDYLRLRAEKLHNTIALKDSGLHNETLDFMEKISVLVQDYTAIKERALERVSSSEFSERRVRISGSSDPSKSNEIDGPGLPPRVSTGSSASSGYPGKKKIAGLHNGRIPSSHSGGSSGPKSSSASHSHPIGSMSNHLKQRGNNSNNNTYTGVSSSNAHSHPLNEGESFDSLGHSFNGPMGGHQTSAGKIGSSKTSSSKAGSNSESTSGHRKVANGKSSSSSSSNATDNNLRRQRAHESNAGAGSSSRSQSRSPTPSMTSGTTTPRRSRSGRQIRPPHIHGDSPEVDSRRSPTMLQHDGAHAASSSTKNMHLNDSLTFSNMSFSNASPIEKDSSRIRMTPLHDHDISLGPLEAATGSPIFPFDLDAGVRPSRTAIPPGGDESLGSILDANSLLGRSNISQMLRDDSSFNTNLHGSDTLQGSTPLSVSDALRAARAGLSSSMRSNGTPPKASSSFISDSSKTLDGSKSNMLPPSSFHGLGHGNNNTSDAIMGADGGASNSAQSQSGSTTNGRRKRRITPSCISPSVTSPPPSGSSSETTTSSSSASGTAKRRKTSSSSSAFRSPTARSRTKAQQACGSASGDSKLGVDAVDSFLSKVAYN
ncbi:Hypothetical Protein FCC1311_069542 [Hondaea fermentalgiana]|uniref:Uncharacterized protein n=1 Tax=Hondaea fermentalgiana TaxID=2315210 RepID=A0A2R5GS82_9STRA|nr:Hypothetical Protein FCC1311_069542 [Hondaea fermentalgiana]|eukprot:GBG30734.1 Hypothetical Protein FCC1311_069542 [Hondaea fermentalgiana]